MDLEHCVGCERLAIMFIQIGTYRLWMCEEHARETHENLALMIEDVDRAAEA